MDAWYYRQPEPTWMKLQRQYEEQNTRILLVPQMHIAPQQTAVGLPTVLAGVAAFGSALFLLFGSGNNTQDALAMQIFGAGVTGLLSA